jgi:FdhD protein
VNAENALDKLVGWGVLNRQIPFHEQLLFTTGRATFSTLQRAGLAGVPIVCCQGAPSSLALSIAYRFDMTLLVVAAEVHVYTGRERLQ